MRAQPYPFEYKNGSLVDFIGEKVDFSNPANLIAIAGAFRAVNELAEDFNNSMRWTAENVANGEETLAHIETGYADLSGLSDYCFELDRA